MLKGVHIGNNVIIGAGSVVTHSIPPDSVVAGNPAKVVCTIDDYMKKRETQQLTEAVELVMKYREAYNTDPGDEELAEFFWLYTGETDEYALLPDIYKKKMKLIGNESYSIQKLEGNKKSFLSKEQFLDSIDV